MVAAGCSETALQIRCSRKMQEPWASQESWKELRANKEIKKIQEDIKILKDAKKTKGSFNSHIKRLIGFSGCRVSDAMLALPVPPPML